MMGAFTAIGSGLAISAALIYVLLRFLVAEPSASNTAAAVSRHAFWTALIAFLASGTSGLANIWINPDENPYNQTSVPTLIMHATAPGLWLGIVYVLGQFTWPRHLKPVRAASLEVRRLRMLVPKFLAGFLLLCTAISTVLILVAWNDAGSPDRVGTEISSGLEFSIPDGDTDEYGNPVDTDGNLVDRENPEDDTASAAKDAAATAPQVSPITGTRPGNEVGPYLLGGLAMALLGSLGAATAVVRRPPLDSLDPAGNEVLRSIWINRLLRTTIYVVANFGAAAIGYLTEGIRARSDWLLPAGGSGHESVAEDRANLLNGVSTLWILLVIVVIVAAGPPKLQGRRNLTDIPDGAPSASFSKARDFLLLTHCVGFFVMLACFTFLGLGSAGATLGTVTSPDGTRTFSFDSSTPTRLQSMGFMALALLLAAAGYLLLNLLAAWIIDRRVCGQPVEVPRRHLLPVWFLTVLALAVAVGLASVAGFAAAGPVALKPAAWWAAGVLAAVAALAWALCRTASRRGAIDGASAEEDTRVRILVAHRGVRVLGGVSLLVASMLGDPTYWAPSGGGYGESMYFDHDPSGFQVITMVLGIILCLLPAATAHRSARSGTRVPSPSNR